MRKKEYDFLEDHFEFSDIANFFVDTAPGVILLMSAILGSAGFGLYKLYDKLEAERTKNQTFSVSEATILAKLSQQDVSGNGYTVFTKPIETKYDYEFVLDIDNDGVYDISKDIIIEGEKIPFAIAEENNKIVLFETKDKSGNIVARKLIGFKDENSKLNIVGGIPYNKHLAKNESYNKTEQFFKDKYLNQR